MQALGETQNQLLTKFEGLKTALRILQTEQKELKVLLTRIEEKKNAGGDLMEIPEVLSAANINSLRAQLIDLRTSRAILDVDFGARSKQVQENELLTRETKRNLDEAIAQVVFLMKTKYEDGVAREARLNKDIDEADAEVRNLERLMIKNKDLEANVEIGRAHV